MQTKRHGEDRLTGSGSSLTENQMTLELLICVMMKSCVCVCVSVSGWNKHAYSIESMFLRRRHTCSILPSERVGKKMKDGEERERDKKG